MNKEWLELLIYSFDQELSPEQEKQLSAALTGSEELRQEKVQLLKTRDLLKELQPPEKENFADDVMEQLQYQKSTELGTIIVSLFPKVAAACILAIIVTLAAIYMFEGSLSTEAILGIQDLSLEDVYGLAD